MITKADCECMVRTADALHYLFFGILRHHPHDEVYKELIPHFMAVKHGLNELAGGDEVLDADAAVIFKKLSDAMATKKAAKPKAKASKPKSKGKGKKKLVCA
jgi:hypothetical protein